MSLTLARHVLANLSKAGVVEAVICPGGRNAAFVELIADPESPIKPYWHFEERSASFFALGRIKQSGKPVAVITTSGTAAGELLPAVMEAYYSGLPLVVVTADRPTRFRGSGAPQAAEQAGLFRQYAPLAFDLDGDDEMDLFHLDSMAPVHINVCLEDPNGEQGDSEPGTQMLETDPSRALHQFLEACRRPLVVVSSLPASARESVTRFLLKLNAPAYFEAQSGLREAEELCGIRLHIGDSLFQRSDSVGHEFDGVLRIGGVPTHRIWRDLEDRFMRLPVASVTRLPFSGLGRPSVLCCVEIGDFLGALSPVAKSPSDRLFAHDRELAGELVNRLGTEPKSEPALIHGLSQIIEPNSRVFVGNSLPIREWDLAVTFESRGFEVSASRGLNGIDGQVSTFLGMCAKDRPNWAILGDLTALYDLPGLWVGRHLDPGISATIVVINNSGGRIFQRMFPQTEFLNDHSIGFEKWAQMWGVDYQLCNDATEAKGSMPGLRIVELRPDPEATDRFWMGHAEAMK